MTNDYCINNYSSAHKFTDYGDKLSKVPFSNSMAIVVFATGIRIERKSNVVTENHEPKATTF